MSFASKYATIEGGRHFTYVSNLAKAHFKGMLKEKMGTSLEKQTIRKHVWVFIN
jgi:hypothetical protein